MLGMEDARDRGGGEQRTRGNDDARDRGGEG